MKDGFIKVAAATSFVSVGDIAKNTESIKALIEDADKQKINLLVFPELCLTGYTCGDLVFSEILIESSKSALTEIAKFTEKKYPCVIIGLPIKYNSGLYNAAAFIANGKILGITAKTNTGKDNRFCSADKLMPNAKIIIDGSEIPFGNDIVFCHSSIDDYKIATEIGTDLFSPMQPSSKLCISGATIIANPLAIPEIVGSYDDLALLVTGSSKRLCCGYVISGASNGESTQDGVYSSPTFICENGSLLASKRPFEDGSLTVSEIDVSALSYIRRNTWNCDSVTCRYVNFEQEITETKLSKNIKPNPFLPSCDKSLNSYSELIFEIQSNALARRLKHTNAKKAVLGISGGLDSTLALLVAARAMRILGRSAKDILAITMPCFGTTSRTKKNSKILCELLDVDFKEINIADSVEQHFKDIGQNPNRFDVTFENSQARERTQVLMDIANKENGIVVGTGDLSELALGWATYNGDHMSMYGVNAGIPKTVIRQLVAYEAASLKGELEKVLLDVIATPVSPELLPSDQSGSISQKTEDLVGPYELHDFFLYNMLAFGASPTKIYRLAKIALNEYNDQTIIKWLEVFTKRFFTQQFKRSCLPDGPQVFSVNLSPRAAFKMPTDASYNLWLSKIEKLK